MSIYLKSCLFLLLCSIFNLASAEQLLVARVKMNFPETMLELQNSIKTQGYTLSRVQRVDIGLTKSGYTTDKYRVVFFGKPEEIKALIKKHPELIPYLPLNIAIYAEGEDTMLVAYDPEYLFPHEDKELNKIFTRWRKDLTAIFEKTAK